MSQFDKLASSNVRRLPTLIVSETPSAEANMDVVMRKVGAESVVKDVLIPRLRARIEQLDEDESAELGTPRQFEIRGRRLEAKDELANWLKWSGQARSAPDKESL